MHPVKFLSIPYIYVLIIIFNSIFQHLLQLNYCNLCHTTRRNNFPQNKSSKNERKNKSNLHNMHQNFPFSIILKLTLKSLSISNYIILLIIFHNTYLRLLLESDSAYNIT